MCLFAPFFHALAAIPAGLTNMAGWMASFFLVECSEFERRSAIEALRIKEKEAEVCGSSPAVNESTRVRINQSGVGMLEQQPIRRLL